jgi:hypothetical protein
MAVVSGIITKQKSQTARSSDQVDTRTMRGIAKREGRFL